MCVGVYTWRNMSARPHLSIHTLRHVRLQNVHFLRTNQEWVRVTQTDREEKRETKKEMVNYLYFWSKCKWLAAAWGLICVRISDVAQLCPCHWSPAILHMHILYWSIYTPCSFGNSNNNVQIGNWTVILIYVLTGWVRISTMILNTHSTDCGLSTWIQVLVYS